MIGYRALAVDFSEIVISAAFLLRRELAALEEIFGPGVGDTGLGDLTPDFFSPKDLPKTTEAERLVIQRIGQDIFRDALMHYWGSCCPVRRLNRSIRFAQHTAQSTRAQPSKVRAFVRLIPRTVSELSPIYTSRVHPLPFCQSIPVS